MDGRDALGAVGPSVCPGHGHAAEANRRCGSAVDTQVRLSHARDLPGSLRSAGVPAMRTKLGAMREQQASRTLLKSPPELWAECSDAQSLAKHLGEFGEIRINKLEPEHTVAWEGDRASGTVKLEPSGWGTRVTLTYSTLHSEQVPPQPVLEPEPEPQVERSPDGEPEPVSSEPKADAAPTSEQPPAGQNRGRLFKRVLRFLAPERGRSEE